MYITYHKEVVKRGDTILFSFKHFSKEIKSFLVERDVVQEQYELTSNQWYMFIYLDNGDRVDVQL